MPVVVVDPDARTETLGILVGVRDVILMREQDVGDTSGIRDPRDELTCITWGVDQEVAARAGDEVRVRAEGRTRVEPAAPNVLGDRLRKNVAFRAGLPCFAAHRGGRADEHGAPGSDPVLRRRGLPRENALAVAFNDEVWCDMAGRPQSMHSVSMYQSPGAESGLRTRFTPADLLWRSERADCQRTGAGEASHWPPDRFPSARVVFERTRSLLRIPAGPRATADAPVWIFMASVQRWIK
jgi:hypothetical protein